MLNIDLRIESTMPRNMKIRRLTLALGDGAAFSLIRLWCHAREEAPTDGVLRNLSDDEVEAIVAEWKGERGAFIKTCIDLGLLERIDGFVTIHDWETNQPWAVKQGWRYDRSSKAGKASAAKRKEQQAVQQQVQQVDELVVEQQVQPLSSPLLSSPLHTKEHAAVATLPATSQGVTTRKPNKNHAIVDEATLVELEASPAYKGIDVRIQYAKAVEWIKVHKGRKCNKAFLVNWLNNCQPMTPSEIDPAESKRKKLTADAEECQKNHTGKDCSDSYGMIPGQQRCQYCPVRAQKEKARGRRQEVAA